MASAAEQELSHLSRCYNFLTENVLGAVVGVAWTYFVPFLPANDPYAFIAAIVNDALGTGLLSILVYYLVKRLNLGAGEEEEVIKSPGRKARHIRAKFKDDFGEQLIQGFSMAISVLHTIVADFLWVWVSWLSTHKQSTAGSCVQSFQTTQIWAAYLLAIAVCFLFGSISLWCTEKAEKATSQEKQLVWDLVASSFSYAIGMSFYNAMSFSLTCMPHDLYYKFQTQVIRAVVLTLIVIPFYYYAIPRLSTTSCVRRGDLIGGIAEDIVYTIFANAWISAYSEPVDYLYSDDADTIDYLVALGMTLLFLVVIYNGWVVDVGDESAADRTPRLLNNLMGWLTMMAWWDPLDNSFTALFTSSTGLDRDYSFVISIAVALLFTALSAFMSAAASVLFPKDDLREFRKIVQFLPSSWSELIKAITPHRAGQGPPSSPPHDTGSGPAPPAEPPEVAQGEEEPLIPRQPDPGS